ncbi:ABC transporter ATP-binding protein [Fusibacter sp. 3D3]|uniref:ABC transporter ATP-binding protein n=1 Tax=Fusibacter sp. 3D3 TaxID=1048380 RepID=UPI00085396B1|nr:ABC transporter ATP-binding protein [Fusibacter sp. 3D3]GAU76269.1 oligopeptide transport system permease protein OppB [Fusibacter sp. 3D3]
MAKRILEVKNMHFSFYTYAGEVHAVNGVSFYVDQGETLAIVGESGCGKSVTVQSIMKLTPTPPGKLKQGKIEYMGEDITHYTQKEISSMRGKEMSMIFQDPMTSLNPTMRIGHQIAEGILSHENISKEAAKQKAIEMLIKVGLPNPEKNFMSYPHQFSGGMRQRVMIAIALVCNPKILFADEPTTALDVTVQAQILELMNTLKREFKASVVLITHDLGVVAKTAQRIAVMYAGKIVETGTARDVFYDPKHPYTWGLLDSVPSTGAQSSRTLNSIEGSPPDLFCLPKGCSFAARCKYCMNICREIAPEETVMDNGHRASCWLLDCRAPSVPPQKRVSRVSKLDIKETAHVG